jgi:hypothetical protein
MRGLGHFLLYTLFAAAVCGCAPSAAPLSGGGARPAQKAAAEAPAADHDGTANTVSVGEKAGLPSGRPAAGSGAKPPAPPPPTASDLTGPDVGVPSATEAPPAKAPAAAEAMAGAEASPRMAKARDSKAPPSGILTAGSFDDNLNPPFFHTFLGKLAQDAKLGDLPSRLRGRRLLVSVKDTAGKPVGNARVNLAVPGVGPGVDLVSRSDGRAVFVSTWDQVAMDGEVVITVTGPDGSGPVKETVPGASDRWEVTLPSVKAELPRNLDLAIVLDTTGSMGDELEYLKSEIKGIVAAVHERFPDVNQRYALVLYRDDGDEYLTRPFDFTPAVDDFRRNLAAQSAAGGGDYPEAMHRGLEEAVQLRWREDNTARVLFLVADAPPHQQFVGRTMNAANSLRRKGVSIYPVACSGYDETAELVMRGCAMLTGSQFLFLTDDSGVGNSHAEPHIPFYHVQKLDRMMIRMISAELAGRRIEPERGDIIRTVGKPIN